MCGVYLRISEGQPDLTVSQFDKSNLNQLSKRGPDGTHFQNNASNSALYGFTRLAIRALISGDQPYVDERFISAFNCEIYNTSYLENKIKTAFQSEKIPEGDAQLLGLWLYLFGPDAISEVRGMFAGYLVIENKIYAFRDRVGEKPLCYGFYRNIFYVSSNIPIFANTMINTSDAELISGLHKESLSKDTHILDPGTYIEINQNLLFINKKIVKHRYWSWPRRNLVIDRKVFSNFENEVTESIKSQLVSDVGICSMLSGGIDSGIVTAIARNEVGPSMKAFTLAFADSDYDESHLASLTAKHLDLNHEVIRVNFEELAENVKPSLNAMDFPIFDTGALSLFTLSKAVAKENKVSLTGDGGDELFRGYSVFKYLAAINLLTKVPSKISIKLLQFLTQANFTNKDTYLGPELKIKRALSVVLNQGISPLHAAIGPLGGTDLFNTLSSRILNNSNVQHQIISKNALELFFINEILPKIYLAKADRMSMTHGLELRAPLLDYKVIESAYGQSQINLSFSKRKSSLKHMGEKYLPKDVLVQKHGFSTPFHKVVRYLDMPDWKSPKTEEELKLYLKIWQDAKNGLESASTPAWSLIVREHFYDRSKRDYDFAV